MGERDAAIINDSVLSFVSYLLLFNSHGVVPKLVEFLQRSDL